MTTLSKKQAAAISDDLMAQETHRANVLRNRRFTLIHPLYRFPELSSIPPWKQSRLIQVAGSLADKRLPVILSIVLFVAAILGVAFFASPERQNYSFFLAVFVFFGMPFVLIRRAIVHHYVVELLTEETAVK